MDESADTPRALRSPLEEPETTGKAERPTGPLARLFTAFISPIRRVIVGPVEDRQLQIIASLHENDAKLNRLEQVVEEHARIHEDLRSMRTAITSHIESLENAKVRAADDIATLQGDAKRARDHLANLQHDCSEIKQAIAELADQKSRLEDLWADLHRDMTALAEAFSRLESD